MRFHSWGDTHVISGLDEEPIRRCLGWKGKMMNNEDLGSSDDSPPNTPM